MIKKSSHSSHDAYERQAAICKAFANPTRLQLIDLLGRKERWASELQEGLGHLQGQSLAASLHLANRGRGSDPARRQATLLWHLDAGSEAGYRDLAPA